MRCSNFMRKTTCHATLNSSTITNEQNIVLKLRRMKVEDKKKQNPKHFVLCVFEGNPVSR